MSTAAENAATTSLSDGPIAENAPGTFESAPSLSTPYMSVSSSAVSGQSHSQSIYDPVAQTAKQDDSVLFERLVQRHQDRLYRVAYRMTGNADEAQDLLQDAIVEAFRAFAHFNKGTYFDKWLYRIMSRTFIDRKRSQKRARVLSLDEPAFGDGSQSESNGFERLAASDESDPALKIDRATLDYRVQEGLDRLTPEYRLVLILTDIEEFSYEEVAAMLGCPIGTVRSRLHRARAQMREHLTKSGYRV